VSTLELGSNEPTSGSGEAAAFQLCAFCYIDDRAIVGRRSESVQLFDDVVGRRNRVGLLSEDTWEERGWRAS
jgi:hypothetical protein